MCEVLRRTMADGWPLVADFNKLIEESIGTMIKNDRMQGMLCCYGDNLAVIRFLATLLL